MMLDSTEIPLLTDRMAPRNARNGSVESSILINGRVCEKGRGHHSSQDGRLLTGEEQPFELSFTAQLPDIFFKPCNQLPMEIGDSH